jgi:hypothetical protein
MMFFGADGPVLLFSQSVYPDPGRRLAGSYFGSFAVTSSSR